MAVVAMAKVVEPDGKVMVRMVNTLDTTTTAI